MLVTDVGDKMCWRKLSDVGDSFSRFRHKHPLSFDISVGQQHLIDIINIEIPSPKPKNCHQHLCSRFRWWKNLIFKILSWTSKSTFISVLRSSIFTKYNPTVGLASPGLKFNIILLTKKCWQKMLTTECWQTLDMKYIESFRLL